MTDKSWLQASKAVLTGRASGSVSLMRNFSMVCPWARRCNLIVIERSEVVSGKLPIPASAFGQNTENSVTVNCCPVHLGTTVLRSNPALSNARSPSLASSFPFEEKIVSASSRRIVGASFWILRNSTASVALMMGQGFAHRSRKQSKTRLLPHRLTGDET